MSREEDKMLWRTRGVCAPPPSQLDGEEKRSVRGDKVGGRGQREAEETESV